MGATGDADSTRQQQPDCISNPAFSGRCISALILSANSLFHCPFSWIRLQNFDSIVFQQEWMMIDVSALWFIYRLHSFPLYSTLFPQWFRLMISTFFKLERPQSMVQLRSVALLVTARGRYIEPRLVWVLGSLALMGEVHCRYDGVISLTIWERVSPVVITTKSSWLSHTKGEKIYNLKARLGSRSLTCTNELDSTEVHMKNRCIQHHSYALFRIKLNGVVNVFSTVAAASKQYQSDAFQSFLAARVS